MGAISTKANSVFRDGVDGAHFPVKSEIRDLFKDVDSGVSQVETAIQAAQDADGDAAVAGALAAQIYVEGKIGEPEGLAPLDEDGAVSKGYLKFKAADEIAFRAIEDRIVETKVLSEAYGADPTGTLGSSDALQLILDNLGSRPARIVIGPGAWVFPEPVNIPDGKRIFIDVDPSALMTTTNDIAILEYERPISGVGTDLWVRGGLWAFGGVAKSGGQAIRFKGRSITEHNNSIYITGIETRYFAKSIDLAYTRGTISDIKGLENGNTIYGGPDASFVRIRDGFDQNSDVPIRFTGTGEAAGVSNGLHISNYYSVGAKNRDFWITRYDLVQIVDCSGDLGGTVGVDGDAAVYLEQCTHYSIIGGYFTSRGTAYDYQSPRIRRSSIYLEDCWGGVVEANLCIGFSDQNLRIVNTDPDGDYFGNLKARGNNFEGTTGNDEGDNTSLHIIGIGLETFLNEGNSFTPIDDFNYSATPTPRASIYAGPGTKAWKSIANFLGDTEYTVPLSVGNMENISNTWSARVAQ